MMLLCLAKTEEKKKRRSARERERALAFCSRAGGESESRTDGRASLSASE